MVYLALAKESNASDDEAVSEASSKESVTGEAQAEEQTEEQTEAGSKSYSPNGKKVYLTFDDGPSIMTDDILDILKKNNVKATFFVIYNDDKEVLPYYNRIVDEGHTLGLHSYSHVYEKVYASMDSFKEDVSKIHDYVYERTGVDSRLYRFPGGSSNDVSDNVNTYDMINYLTHEGYTYFDWNAASEDAEGLGLTPEELNENVMEYVRSNEGDSVVLMHDFENGETTVAALQGLIDTLKEEGYEILPIEEDTEVCQHISYDPAHDPTVEKNDQ